MTFTEACEAAFTAGLGFTVERPTRNSPHEFATLTTFVDGDTESTTLICEGVADEAHLFERIAWVAARQREGWT